MFGVMRAMSQLEAPSGVMQLNCFVVQSELRFLL